MSPGQCFVSLWAHHCPLRPDGGKHLLVHKHNQLEWGNNELIPQVRFLFSSRGFTMSFFGFTREKPLRKKNNCSGGENSRCDVYKGFVLRHIRHEWKLSNQHLGWYLSISKVICCAHSFFLYKERMLTRMSLMDSRILQSYRNHIPLNCKSKRDNINIILSPTRKKQNH